MYDTVHCEYPLPNPSHTDRSYQTKSLVCALFHYTITRDGRLVQDAWRDGRYVPDGDWAFHGDVIMCGDDPASAWIEYRVRFTDGRVARVDLLGPPATGQERLEREVELDFALMCPKGAAVGLDGRALSLVDLAALAPEKIELVDGRIAGGAGLLTLLLTNIGLRRTARMVGRDLWRQALDESEDETAQSRR